MVAAKRVVGTTDDESGLASNYSGPHTTCTRNLCPEPHNAGPVVSRSSAARRRNHGI